jgi:membrane protease YdiL (CAAX protease family)
MRESKEPIRDAINRIATYLGLTFALSAVFYGLIISAGTLTAGGGLYTLGLMWCPGIAAMATTLVFQRNLKGLGWRLGNVRYLVLAYALPLAYAAVAYVVAWNLGLGAFSADGLPAGQSLLSFLAINATVGVALSLLPAMGEEIGWRGFLVPELARITGFTKTALLSGAIWAVWHMPLILFADYHSGAPLWFGLACFTVMVIGISFAFAWLRLRSGSFWPAALMHASHNLFIQQVFDPLTQDTGITACVTGEFGAALAIAAIVIAYTFWRLRPTGEGLDRVR